MNCVMVTLKQIDNELFHNFMQSYIYRSCKDFHYFQKSKGNMKNAKKLNFLVY